eukprot:TRINITY_DN6253_c0_g1_i16.p1 TRINITY_DN6253_c0_g1~~TRINITY_DN6253_c0_g1_i16.p1  ORF type:complete len:235 (+),score=-12.96 TRINITY_DN6253_c0_g1_i16:53-706(+)
MQKSPVQTLPLITARNVKRNTISPTIPILYLPKHSKSKTRQKILQRRRISLQNYLPPQQIYSSTKITYHNTSETTGCTTYLDFKHSNTKNYKYFVPTNLQIEPYLQQTLQPETFVEKNFCQLSLFLIQQYFLISIVFIVSPRTIMLTKYLYPTTLQSQIQLKNRYLQIVIQSRPILSKTNLQMQKLAEIQIRRNSQKTGISLSTQRQGESLLDSTFS